MDILVKAKKVLGDQVVLEDLAEIRCRIWWTKIWRRFRWKGTSKGTTTTSSNTRRSRRRGRSNGSPLGVIPGRSVQGVDPLSQTFKVDENGAFLTSVDLFFATKDTSENLTVEIRTTEFGVPTTQLVQDFARAVVNPDDIQVSDNGESCPLE